MDFVMIKTTMKVVYLMEVTVVLVQQKPICFALHVNVFEAFFKVAINISINCK